MKRLLIRSLCLVLIFLLIGCAARVTQNPDAPQQSLPLPKQINLLLTLEMQAISKGMMELVPTIATADWKNVAKIGLQIKHSYIMQQQLTPQQRKTLQRVLPKEFKKLDFEFHLTANKLAYAAEQQNPELVNFYFYRLNEACSQCHSRFALEKFPGFINPNSEFNPNQHQ